MSHLGEYLDFHICGESGSVGVSFELDKKQLRLTRCAALILHHVDLLGEKFSSSADILL